MNRDYEKFYDGFLELLSITSFTSLELDFNFPIKIFRSSLMALVLMLFVLKGWHQII